MYIISIMFLCSVLSSIACFYVGNIQGGLGWGMAAIMHSYAFMYHALLKEKKQ